MQCEMNENSNEELSIKEDAAVETLRHRRLQRKWTSEEDRIMVAMIEGREAIWKCDSAAYKNSHLKRKCWMEIADKTNHSVSDAKIHWNTVKSRFNLERKKVLMSKSRQNKTTYKSKYKLYKLLQFLSKVGVRPTGGNATKLVIDALGNDAIDMDEAKSKWMNLRATFKRNLDSLHPKKSGQSTNKSVSIAWKYFNQMKFLEANVIAQSTQSTSATDLVIEADRRSNVEDSLSLPTTPHTSDDNEVISVPIPKKWKRSPSLTPASPQNLQRAVLMNEISNFLKNQKEVPPKTKWKSVFSEFIYCELDRYEEHDAQNLKKQLTMVCMNFQPEQNMCADGTPSSFLPELKHESDESEDDY